MRYESDELSVDADVLAEERGCSVLEAGGDQENGLSGDEVEEDEEAATDEEAKQRGDKAEGSESEENGWNSWEDALEGGHSLAGHVLVGCEGPNVEDVSWESEEGDQGQRTQSIDQETFLVEAVNQRGLSLRNQKKQVEGQGANSSSTSTDGSCERESEGEVLQGLLVKVEGKEAHVFLIFSY